MNTSVCARRGERGFSFIELLITMIIVAIAFLAMVPLFVQAEKKNSADQVRNQALNVAQDRMEKVRALDYDQISNSNLNSGSFGSGAFGPTATLSSATTDRVMAVTYGVTTYPTGATALTSQYKVVIVSVSWTPPPSPVKTVLLQTVIYRQYAGPEIARLWTDPSMSQDARLGSSSGDLVKFSAIPDTGWTNGNTKTVHFQVWDNGGTLVTDKTVTYGLSDADSGVTGDAFWWNWNSSFAVDGTYKITATASNGTSQGSAVEYYFVISRGSAPGIPAWSSASVPSNSQVSLGWQAVPTATSYEVFRSASSSGPWTRIATPTATSFTDTGLAANTMYWYTVRSVNASGHSAEAIPLSATTGEPISDAAPPTVPAGVTITGDSPSLGVIHLAWAASTDVDSGILDYQIYRSSTGAMGSFTLLSTQPSGNLTFNDTVGSAPTARTYYYQIVARDLALNASQPSDPVFATVRAVSSIYSLTLQNSRNSIRYAWVQCIIGSTAPFYYLQNGGSQASAPAGVAVAAKNGTQTWANLPPGTYNIWVSTSGTFPSNPQTSSIVTTVNVTQAIR